MGPEVLQLKAMEIDTKADREKSTVKAIIDIIEGDEDRMQGIILTDEERESSSSRDLDLLLFERVARILQEVDDAFVAPVGVRVINGIERQPVPLAIQLGWEEYVPHQDDGGRVYAYSIQATPGGLEAVNMLREARGYVSARKQLELNRSKRWPVFSSQDE